MNDRWARDGLSAEDACWAELDRGTAYAITGRYHLKSQRDQLETLAKHASISVGSRAGFITIHWPKLAEFQGWHTRDRGEQMPSPKTRRDETRKPLKKEAPAPPDAAPDSPDIHNVESLQTIQTVDAPIAPLIAPDMAPLANILPVPEATPNAVAFTRQYRINWLNQNRELLIAEVEKQGLETQQQNRGALKSLAIRYWKQHLRNPAGLRRNEPERFEDAHFRRLRGQAKGEES